MTSKRYLIFSVPIVVFLLSQAFLWKPSLWYIWVFLIVISLSIIFFLILRKNYKKSWILLINPLLLFFSSLAYVSVLVNNIYIQLIIIFLVVFVTKYFYLIYKNKQNIKTFKKLNDLMLTGGLISIFFSTAIIYTLPAFINWSLWFSLLLIIPVVYLLFYQYKFIKYYNKKSFILLSVFNTLILLEIIYSVSLLPLNFNILASINLISYYLLCLFNYLYWNNNFSFKKIKIPIILSITIVLLLLLTAQWL